MKEVKEQYKTTTDIVDINIDEIVEEIIFLHQTQTAILRNDYYLVKDKDTQSVFESVLCRNQKKISPNNHQKEFDIKHSNNKISIKSGTITNECLKISYSRTTEHPSLEQKINYLSTFDNLILGIASEKIKNNKDNIANYNRYYLYYFTADIIPLKSMEWVENNGSYLGHDSATGISVDIKKKLSDQPWINIPSHLIKIKPILETSIVSHKNRKYLVVDNLLSNERSYFDIYEQRKKLKALTGIKKCSIFTTKAVMD